jgi:radical SAM protein with 4Fe4S-binding SPASM domain
MLSELSTKFGVTAKIDCSFVPMLCYHRPPPEMLTALSTYGCDAGNVLLGVRSDGIVSGCSFLKSPGISIFELENPSIRRKFFNQISTWPKRAREPCRSCEYLDICKGGCHGVSEHVTGDFDNPDPDCPFVVQFHNRI